MHLIRSHIYYWNISIVQFPDYLNGWWKSTICVQCSTEQMRTINGETRMRNICFLIINVHYSTCNYRYKPAVHVSSVSHHNCNRNQEGVGDHAGCLWVRGGSTHRHALTQKCVSIPSLTNVWMFSQILTFRAIESIHSPQSSYFKNEGRNQNAQEFFRGGVVATLISLLLCTLNIPSCYLHFHIRPCSSGLCQTSYACL